MIYDYSIHTYCCDNSGHVHWYIISVGDKVKLQKIVQMAWTFVNDRYVSGGAN